MRKVINCLTEHNPLINKPLKKVSVEEGMKIATELFEILNQRKDGIGLAGKRTISSYKS
jgi:predicted DNA-binding antitoxin AbrB/MazE fold protein